MGILHAGDDGDATRAPRPGIGDLATLVERARAAGLPVDVTIEGRRAALPPGLDVAAFRIVQDALANALERSAPATAHVAVRYAGDALALEISDDGAHAAGGDDAALAGLRERVALYGGEVEAGHRGDGEFSVRARLPLEGARR
jgi:signal transduction histidine kinase